MKPRKILRRLFGRNAMSVMLLILQAALLAFSVVTIGERFYMVYVMLIILDIVLVIYLMNKKEPDSYKLTWIITISIFPLFGGLAYVLIKRSQKYSKDTVRKYQEQGKKYLLQDNKVSEQIKEQYPQWYGLSRYVFGSGMYPVCQNSRVEYFSLGEDQFTAMLNEIEKAERFIFLEYFIISEGFMLETLSALLKKKAGEGVEIKLMYDGIGTGLNKSSPSFRELEEAGIRCRAFNPFTPFLSSIQNNRDHRKIVVIDGKAAFSGGTNLADEYINMKVRFGHWKDTAVKITGEAVWNYTVMFLQLWEIQTKEKINYDAYRAVCDKDYGNCSIQPFSDSPLDDEQVGRQVYTELISKATDHVYITTPYLIIDEEMINALTFAAKKGVDVRIITPHIPDKWYVYMIAWNNYPKLIEAGVKIYEYTPGFIHAKSCIADDEAAMVGTINFDFRSFYLHFESGAIMYGSPVISEIREDFEETLKRSQLITMEDCHKRPVLKKIYGALLNMFAPLL